MSAPGNRQAIGPPSSDRSGEEEEEEVRQELLSRESRGGGVDVAVSVHPVYEEVASEDKEAERCLSVLVPGSRTSVSCESSI